MARIVDLLKVFRTNRAPIFHIRHEGTTPNLNGEFARIVTTDEVVASFAAK